MRPAELKQRWTTARTRAAIAALHGQGALQDAAFGSLEGRLDLRGLTIPDARNQPADIFESRHVPTLGNARSIKDATWTHLDLSHSSLQNIDLFSTSLQNCRFTNANLTNVGFRGVTIADCDFGKAQLQQAALSTRWNGQWTRFVRCDFTAAKLHPISCMTGYFEDCTFARVKLRSEWFQSTVFRGCDFTDAKLHQVLFDGSDPKGVADTLGLNDMHGCDFTHASLHDVSFRGIDARNMTLPHDPDLLIVPDWSNTGASAMTWLTTPGAVDRWNTGVRNGAIRMLEIHRSERTPPGGSGVVDLRTFQNTDYDGQDLADCMADAIHHALADPATNAAANP